MVNFFFFYISPLKSLNYISILSLKLDGHWGTWTGCYFDVSLDYQLWIQNLCYYAKRHIQYTSPAENQLVSCLLFDEIFCCIYQICYQVHWCAHFRYCSHMCVDLTLQSPDKCLSSNKLFFICWQIHLSIIIMQSKLNWPNVKLAALIFPYLT